MIPANLLLATILIITTMVGNTGALNCHDYRITGGHTKGEDVTATNQTKECDMCVAYRAFGVKEVAQGIVEDDAETFGDEVVLVGDCFPGEGGSITCGEGKNDGEYLGLKAKGINVCCCDNKDGCNDENFAERCGSSELDGSNSGSSGNRSKDEL